MGEEKHPYRDALGPYGSHLFLFASIVGLVASFKSDAESLGWRLLAWVVFLVCVAWCLILFLAKKKSSLDESVRVLRFTHRPTKIVALVLTILSTIPAGLALFWRAEQPHEPPANDASLNLTLQTRPESTSSSTLHVTGFVDRDGCRVLINGFDAAVTGRRFNGTVSLSPGRNEIQVLAIGVDDAMDKETFFVVSTPELSTTVSLPNRETATIKRVRRKWSARGGSSASAAPVSTRHRIGCWSLEKFNNDSPRGFPESTVGGPRIPPRTDAQIKRLADAILTDIDVKLLVLTEVNGTDPGNMEGDSRQQSQELDKLVGFLPDSWSYEISEFGRAHRIAILFDCNAFRVNEIVDYDVEPIVIQRKSVFDRPPFAAYLTCLADGIAMNDLVVVGIHLASGQRNNRNHDFAMRHLQRMLAESQREGELGTDAERDLVIMGNFNANRFRPPVEQFWDEMERGNWKVLAGDGYPATRLSGNPLELGNSQIDYIFATKFDERSRGLVGEEIETDRATVH